MKPNRHIKAFRYGVDKFPRWMSYYVENRRFIPQADCSGSWALLHQGREKEVVREGDWVVETHYHLHAIPHEIFIETYQSLKS